MKLLTKFLTLGLSTIIISLSGACSDEKDNPDIPNSKAITTILGFKNVPKQYFGGPTSYGANLYEGAVGQITTGYLAPLGYEKYAQFSINYGFNYDAEFNSKYCYTFYNGGIALSDYHDMDDNSYLNQLSVYNPSSPSEGSFVVSNGFADIPDIMNAKYSDFDGCGRIYITDVNGYSVKSRQNQVSGEDEDGWFKSVWINNTTYTFKVIENGNTFGVKPLEDQKGWFKVQFIAFEDAEANDQPLGYTEAYLANFDESLKIGYTGIIDEWIKVDLSMLPKASILVINFAGSDIDPIYGLNTPAYCALDNFEITVDDK